MIHQKVLIPNATAKQIYMALMNSDIHSEFTGEHATIENKFGGKITAYGDYIEGENTKLVENKLIVQKWRASDWPEGDWSEVIYKLIDKKDGCELTFSQTGVPDAMAKDVEQGWIDYYWEPLRKYFSK